MRIRPDLKTRARASIPAARVMEGTMAAIEARAPRTVVLPRSLALVAALVVLACDASSSTGHPCQSYTDCPSDHTCVYEIAKGCAATATCQPKPGGAGALCGAEQELCSCSGEIVVTGCGFPDGFASGPVRGSYSLTCGATDGGTDASGVGSDARPSN